MKLITDVALLKEAISSWKKQGLTIGFVPTMGFLHDGHVSLFALARPSCDRLVASIYVNPLQFGKNEDLSNYPRDPEGDGVRCERAGVDLLFMPETLYPPGFSTSIHIHDITSRWCGASRPGHFEGVATVVARLFGLVQPDVAVFGEKDFQQLQVIRRMVSDLALPVNVVGAPLVRDTDGVALSSRNAYLSKEDRVRATSIPKALHAIASGEGKIADRLERAKTILDIDRLDYLDVVAPDSLQPIENPLVGARVLFAGYIGKTRLIDNMELVPL